MVGKLQMLEDLKPESCVDCHHSPPMFVGDFSEREYRMKCPECGYSVPIPEGAIRDGENIVHVANTATHHWNTAMRKLKL